jgi:hypothetical protein
MSRLDHPDQLKIQEYRAKAIEALDHAALVKDEHTRKAWESIGASYHDMADRLDRKVRGN